MTINKIDCNWSYILEPCENWKVLTEILSQSVFLAQVQVSLLKKALSGPYGQKWTMTFVHRKPIKYKSIWNVKLMKKHKSGTYSTYTLPSWQCTPDHKQGQESFLFQLAKASRGSESILAWNSNKANPANAPSKDQNHLNYSKYYKQFKLNQIVTLKIKTNRNLILEDEEQCHQVKKLKSNWITSTNPHCLETKRCSGGGGSNNLCQQPGRYTISPDFFFFFLMCFSLLVKIKTTKIQPKNK